MLTDDNGYQPIAIDSGDLKSKANIDTGFLIILSIDYNYQQTCKHYEKPNGNYGASNSKQFIDQTIHINLFAAFFSKCLKSQDEYNAP